MLVPDLLSNARHKCAPDDDMGRCCWHRAKEDNMTDLSSSSITDKDELEGWDGGGSFSHDCRCVRRRW